MNILYSIEDAYLYLQNLELLGWKPGLQRVKKLISLLNNPEKKFKSIHIGGTNGKGSITTSLANILKSNHYKVGQFISPELFDFKERIQINEINIDDKSLIECLNKIIKAIDKMLKIGYEHPTHFEVITILAFLYFKIKKIDIAVIEVGLGGDLDATNVIKPILSIITNITIDHIDFLGNTVEKIAEIKSGIIKKNIPIITGSKNYKVLNILKNKAKICNSKIYILGKHFYAKNIQIKKTETIFDFISNNIKKEIKYSLIGIHQVENCAIIIKAIYVLIELGLKININKSIESLKTIKWPGRFEIFNIKNKDIVLDAAHNKAGIKNLTKSIKTLFDYKNLILIIGILDDKDRNGMMKIIGPLTNKIIVTCPKNERVKFIKKVIKISEKYSNVIYENDPVEAFKLGLKLTSKKDLLCITGSIYMIKYILSYIKKIYFYD